MVMINTEPILVSIGSSCQSLLIVTLLSPRTCFIRPSFKSCVPHLSSSPLFSKKLSSQCHERFGYSVDKAALFWQFVLLLGLNALLATIDIFIRIMIYIWPQILHLPNLTPFFCILDSHLFSGILRLLWMSSYST